MLWSKAIGAGGAGGVVEGWNVSTAVFNQSFSVAAQDTSPSGVFFKPDGTKMYVTGLQGDDVNEYDLSTAWDISTAVFLQSFVVEDASPINVSFKADGLKMYIIGLSERKVVEYDLSTAWDISTSIFSHRFFVSSEQSSPQSLFFSTDGTKMYVNGQSPASVHEYDLSTAWDISTAVFLQSFSVAAQDTNPRNMFFKPDGTKMYVNGLSGLNVNEFNLSTAWDISTSVFLQSFSVAAQDTIPRGLFFKPDGLKMYLVGDAGNSVYEYDLTA